MLKKIQIGLIAAGLFVCIGAVGSAKAQAVGKIAKVPSPELVGQLTKGLGITEQQAVGGSGAIFNYAKSNLKAADFKKISSAVPGIDGLMKAAPKAASGGTNVLSSVAGALPGKAGGLASLGGSFQKLGLSQEMVGQFVPVVSKYVESKGGAGVANILTSVLQ